MNDAALPTGCGPVDELLGGGFERGTVTQLYGPPAAGKTNLALSAAVETAVEGGTVVYIDTEGVSVDRFDQLLTARVGNTGAGTDTATDSDTPVARDGGPGPGPGTLESDLDSSDTDPTPDVETVASRIVIEDALDFEEQAEAVRDAEEFAERADLIVLDSATGFYRLERTGEGNDGEALRSVTRQVTHLLSLARKYDLAVVLTNQVFSDPESDRTRALGGNTLEHWTGVVLRLDRFRGGKRRATLEKHRSKPVGESSQFRITDSGVEGGAEPASR
ncbi:DNA repair and recombination protein RadB [Natrialba magadii ATCC 43099]|uniref:DNA repair and recombination protein RadB n=1 Tax=Natrialba magadii (strain ATCC 43099 / DSM 3394 / CCM 3739 / CIP 104546 / IAM 13178 / JCM 8861 / NBRC 102185 / NCIMB 2190 / MS3) TaxID=547559 RepID=D3SVV7_NATMM|nr:AAA family ATPase [Natrialba magadii]ADD03676.1 DNA repair and recombination protein RadB [Natrialba magadii ATCC 43099]ELY34441.1 DNA repair and recombination protein RadB [Natrialba magadii ATCC 43099]